MANKDVADLVNTITNPLIAKERTTQSFDVDTMTNMLDGGKHATMKRRWIWDAHNDKDGGVLDDRERGDLINESMSHFMEIHAKHFERNYRPKGNEMQNMSDAHMMPGGLSLHYGVFMSTLRSQTSDEQKEWWLGRANRLNIIGCYAQTELGHGSNVRGIQTTATYDPKTEEWVCNTPTIAATKWWGTGMYSSTHAALYAQCITPDGVNHGLHVFMVQLRGPDLMPLPGIRIGECGTKCGDNDKTTGWLQLDHVRIPRRHLMEKKAHVEPDGTYVKHSTGKKKASGGGDNDKLAYITMMKTRIALTSTAAGSLAKACVIAVRYAAVREQGFKDSRAGQSHLAPEWQIIDYQTQLFRLGKWTATAYAFKFVARWLLNLRRGVEAGTVSAEELPSVHAASSGLKGLTCKLAADGIEDLRRSCGGHGYLLSSGIAALEADFKFNATAEGDFVVLLLQTARYLLKSRDMARAGEPLAGIVKGLAPLKDPNFNPLRDGKPAVPPGGLTVDTFVNNHQYMVSLFQYRVLVNTAKVADKMEKEVASGIPIDVARNNNALMLNNTATSHIYFFMLRTFADECSNKEYDPACRQVLSKLCSLMACADLMEGNQWHGLLREGEIDLIEEATSTLLTQIRPEMVSLVDAFDYPDNLLSSALGKFDGNYQEALLKTAKVNTEKFHEPSKPPRFFAAVEKFLDKDYLALANGPVPDSMKIPLVPAPTSAPSSKL